MTHLTLNTGHSAFIPASMVSLEAQSFLIDFIGQCLGRQQQPVPLPELPGISGYSLILTLVQPLRVALFTLTGSTPPAVLAAMRKVQLPEMPSPNLTCPLSTCALAMRSATPENAGKLWDNVTSAYLSSAEMGNGVMLAAGNAMPEQPDATPWLATYFHPGIAFLPQAADWMADFNQCFAHVLMDMVEAG